VVGGERPLGRLATRRKLSDTPPLMET
jgi:hypothetical protein